MAMDQEEFKQPLVSIVMCTYNARPFIELAVSSILNQTYQNWELIISDDCSTDGTREWLKGMHDNRIRLYLQERNLGYVANKNFVHREAHGEYITQLDNDDICTLDRIEKQINIIKRYPQIKMVGSAYHRIDDKGNIYGTSTEKEDQIINQFEGQYPFWFTTLLVHKTVFQEIGYFDDYFTGVYGDDLYWTVKANTKYPIYFISEPLYSYRNNPNSITNVLNNERKLIFNDILNELIKQRINTGTDWLEQGNKDALDSLENNLLSNKRIMAEKYRIWAAKAIDVKDDRQAKQLLWKSFNLFPWKRSSLVTLLYYIRSSKLNL